MFSCNLGSILEKDSKTGLHSLMGMEVAENVSELMNMFSGVSNKKNYLVEFVQDDPHMNYATTDEKVNPLLSI